MASFSWRQFMLASSFLAHSPAISGLLLLLLLVCPGVLPDVGMFAGFLLFDLVTCVAVGGCTTGPAWLDPLCSFCGSIFLTWVFIGELISRKSCRCKSTLAPTSAKVLWHAPMVVVTEKGSPLYFLLDMPAVLSLCQIESRTGGLLGILPY